MSIYELVILGGAAASERDQLTRTISSMMNAFGLAAETNITFRDGATVGERDIHSATVAVYFGGGLQVDTDITRDLVRASIPVIPTVAASQDFGGIRRVPRHP